MIKRSGFLALLAAVPLATFVFAESASASTVYTSVSTKLLKSGKTIATMLGTTMATNAATVCNRGVDYIVAHGSTLVAGRYTASGSKILRSGTSIGSGTNSANALDTVNHLNFGEASTGTSGGTNGINLLPASVASTSIGAGAFAVAGNNLPTLSTGTAGGTSALIATSTTTGGNYWIQPTGNFQSVTAGSSYTALATYLPTKAISASSQIQWYNASGALISYSKGTVTAVAAGATTQLIATGTAPAGTTSATVQVTVDSDANATNSIAFLKLGLFAGTSVNTWSAGTGTLSSVPGAPTGVAAVGGNGQAVVSFTAPTNNGGSAITSYIVTATAV